MSGAPASVHHLLSERERVWRARFALAAERPARSARSLVSRRTALVAMGLAVALAALLVVAPQRAAAALYFPVAALSLAASIDSGVGVASARVRARRAAPRAHVLLPPPPLSVLVMVEDEFGDHAQAFAPWSAVARAPGSEVLLVVDAGVHPVPAVDAGARVVRVSGCVESAGFARNIALAEASGGFVAVCSSRARFATQALVDAAELLASSPTVTTAVVPAAPARTAPSVIAAWDDLARRDDACVVVFRRDAIVAAGGWDAFNLEPDRDLRTRLVQDGGLEVVLPVSGSLAPLDDPLRRIRVASVRLAGIAQCALVASRSAAGRARARSLAPLARVAMVLLQPPLTVLSLLVVTRPTGASGLVASFPAVATPVAAAHLAVVAAAYASHVLRAVRLGRTHLVAASLRPVWSLLDACSAVKALLLLIDRRPTIERPSAVPVLASQT